jgi:hypothetical protein
MLPGMLSYDFGYSWWLNWGHGVVAVGAGVLAVLSWHRQGLRAPTLVLAVAALWGAAGAVAMHYAIQIGSPQRLATPSFLARDGVKFSSSVRDPVEPRSACCWHDRT